MTVDPATATLAPNATQAFTATVTGTQRTAVWWAVEEAGGGSVTPAGLYTAPAAGGSYHLRATSQVDQTASAAATVTVQAAGSPPVVTAFAANPASIQPGQQSTLSWTVTGATTMTIDNGVGDVSAVASKLVSPPATTQYKITATNAAGSVTAPATVTVTAPTQKPAISSFIANPTSIQAGQQSTLKWTVTGATTISVDNLVGDVSLLASKAVSPAATTQYKLTAANSIGTSTANATVTVTASAPDATVSIDTSQDHRAISPFVYGYNAGAAANAPAGTSWLRLGGNRWTAYNWTNNYSNAGSDYGPYHNDTYMGSPSDGPGHAALPAVDDAKAHGLGLLVTIPMQGWASKAKDGYADPTKPQTDFFVLNQPKKGSAFTLTPSPSSDPVYQDEFANLVADRWKPSTAPLHFSLDNEPDLWFSTHLEVQRTAIKYTDMVALSVATADAVKTAVPTALTYGPASYGYAGYLNLQNAPDASGKGEWLDYYLAQMAAKSTSKGKRLLDVLDIHFYSEATGCGTRVNGDGGATHNSDCVVAARVQSTRSLWDPNYIESSWITGCCTSNQGIKLMPRMLGKIAANYPGTKVAVTEYNHGGGDHISGAVAQADTLGVLGREGAFAASYWPLLGDERWAFAAWRAFRGYDGAGANYPDTSVQALTTDLTHVASYAGLDAANNRVVLVLVHRPGAVTDGGGNVTGTDGLGARTVKVQLTHPQPLGTVRGWQLKGGTASPSWQSLSLSVSGNSLSVALPALSITTIELKP